MVLPRCRWEPAAALRGVTDTQRASIAWSATPAPAWRSAAQAVAALATRIGHGGSGELNQCGVRRGVRQTAWCPEPAYRWAADAATGDRTDAGELRLEAAWAEALEPLLLTLYAYPLRGGSPACREPGGDRGNARDTMRASRLPAVPLMFPLNIFLVQGFIRRGAGTRGPRHGTAVSPAERCPARLLQERVDR